MMRHVAIAAAIGAVAGGLLGVGFEFGAGAFFWVADRVAGWRETRRELRSAA